MGWIRDKLARGKCLWVKENKVPLPAPGAAAGSPAQPPLALLAAIFESTEDAIVSKDLNGTITSWNPGAERVFGYSAAEAIGRSISMLMPLERLEEEDRILERIRRGERIDHYETVRRRKDGTSVDISVSISPLRDARGRIVGASKIAREITYKKRAEAALRNMQDQLRHANLELETIVAERTAQLRRAVAELEAFSYSVSHDLRAPLRSIHSYARILEEDYGANLPGEGRQYLDRIAINSARLDQLIQDVLTYSRLSRKAIQTEPVNLEKLVAQVLEQHPAFHPLPADFHVDHPLLEVLGHEGSLTQCLLNLLTNAAKFVAPGTRPQVKIWTQRIGGDVRVWIADNGIGIDPSDQERIFGLFERLHPTSVYEGTGIGLAIARKAVQRMQGTIGVESEVGKGSRFWIQLPAADNIIPLVSEAEHQFA